MPQTQSDVRATRAWILRKTNAAVGQKLCRLDPLDGICDQGSEFLPLFVRDRGPQVLDLNQPLADKDHLGDLGNAGDPGVANQLGIESQKPLRLLGIPCCGGFPFEQAALAIEVPHGIDVGDKIVVT